MNVGLTIINIAGYRNTVYAFSDQYFASLRALREGHFAGASK